jgi:hypothetical protein
LVISITLTVLGHKARMKCKAFPEYSNYNTLIILFLVFMWIGQMVPIFGTVLSVIGFIGTIVMITLANNNCVKNNL